MQDTELGLVDAEAVEGVSYQFEELGLAAAGVGTVEDVEDAREVGGGHGLPLLVEVHQVR